MKTAQKPELPLQDKGTSVKTLQAKTSAGVNMQAHQTTKEAVIEVDEVDGMPKMPKANYLSGEKTAFIIPAGAEHHLEIKKNIKAVAATSVNSDIHKKISS